MDNFNLRKFLTENKLTRNSKLLSESYYFRGPSNIPRSLYFPLYDSLEKLLNKVLEGGGDSMAEGDIEMLINQHASDVTDEIFPLIKQGEFSKFTPPPPAPGSKHPIYRPEYAQENLYFNIMTRMEGFIYDFLDNRDLFKKLSLEFEREDAIREYKERFAARIAADILILIEGGAFSKDTPTPAFFSGLNEENKITNNK